MAEASQTEQEPGDSNEGVLKSGEVICNGKPHRLTLRDKGLRLVHTVQDKTGSITGEHVKYDSY